MTYLRFLNNEFINSILDKAEGPDTQIDLYYIPSNIDNLSEFTPSRIFKGSLVEKMWAYDDKGNERGFACGRTVPSLTTIGTADVIMNSEVMEGSMDGPELSNFAVSPIYFLDELNHAISNQSRDDKKELKDHKFLFMKLKDQIDDGSLKINPSIIREIDDKVKEVKKKENPSEKTDSTNSDK